MIGHVFEVVNAWSGLIETALGLVGGWYGNVAKNRLAQRQEQLSAGQQALALVAQTREMLAEHIQRIDVLTRQLWARDDVIQEVYAQAIAARLLVHELDANAGRPPRQFEPLPSYPAPPVEPADPMPDQEDIKKEV
ncbi:hypothetical protein K6L44_04450 [Gluconacetobacter entanii]|uniref:hypothetical protein n=2 Tax=Gluconacetobacter entanii TaxID=108528 RepID=UPI001C932B37|nr:hypothetical protein [Gluconacetobacter entanii]MBY4639264.1 hypothetical protein [Gluconacetobacter entanii]MCW4580184.1 hypothetical protein [Gluconacetobacter entanii]MCW4584666.1 hypothetical protein [Gluconacetobacter entanii]MCW4588072.1 hypothetical protein [Gluconacetobacter entanii]